MQVLGGLQSPAPRGRAMLRAMRRVLLCLLASAPASVMVKGQLGAGDSCEDEVTEQAGVCTDLRQCQWAIDRLRKGIAPQTCTHRGTVPVVCCVSPEDFSPRLQPSDDCPSIPASAVRVAKTGQKAWDKCIDLAETVYRCVYEPTLLIGATKVRLDTCEQKGVELVVGGTLAGDREFPHMALLGYGPLETASWECGGTLISERWVLTAGHCQSRKSLSNVTYVRLGGSNVDARPEPNNTYAVASFLRHPDYKGHRIYNDIALLQLDRVVVFTVSVRPACLHVGSPVNDNRAMATGWGLTTVNGIRSNHLLKVTLDKFSHESCSEANPPERKSPNGIQNATQICFGSETEIKDSCNGDSGGPLQIYNADVHCLYTVIGITSVGKGCGTPGIPGIYTRVSFFVPWIESIVWP